MSKKKAIWLSIFLLIVFTATCFYYVGWASSLLGLFFGSMLTGAFLGWKYLIPSSENSIFTGLAVFLIYALSYFCYSSFYLLYKGVAQTEAITKIRKEQHPVAASGRIFIVTTYSYSVTNYSYELQGIDRYQLGDTIKFIHSPNLYDESGGRLPIIMRSNETISQAVLRTGDSIFIACLMLFIGILVSWFYEIHKVGILLLSIRLKTLDKKILKITSNGLYYLNYAIFILLVLVAFKSTYETIPSKFLVIGTTTIVFMIMIATHWGEKVYALSTKVILDLETPTFIIFLKQCFKIFFFLTLFLLLFEAVTTRNVSILEIINKYFGGVFDLDFGQILDFFGIKTNKE